MMGLPALIKSGGVAAKLERAQGELAKAEAARAELQGRLASLDVEAEDYPATAQTIGAQLSVNQKAIDILSLQIEGLEAKSAAEQERERERRRVAALAKIETLLPKWAEAAKQYETWLKSGAAALAAMTEARRQIVKEWPAEIEPPFAFFMDLTRAIRMLHAAVTPSGVDGEIADGFAARERELMSQLLEGLKDAPKSDEEIAA